MKSGCAEVLGWLIDGDGGKLRPTPRRLGRTRLSLQWMLRRGRASPADIERLAGHMTFISLARRERSSVLSSVYRFAR